MFDLWDRSLMMDRPLPGIGAVVPALLDTLLIYILRVRFEQESRMMRHEAFKKD
jgi:hypothetical protein